MRQQAPRLAPRASTASELESRASLAADRAPVIGIRLASLNLFRESDGSHELTVSEGSVELLRAELKPGQRPIDLIEELVLEAADRMRARREARAPATRHTSERAA